MDKQNCEIDSSLKVNKKLIINDAKVAINKEAMESKRKTKSKKNFISY